METFQKERQGQKREIEQLRRMVQARDELVSQIQADYEYEKERMVNQWQHEKALQQSTMQQLHSDQRRLETELQRMHTKLKKREAQVSQLDKDRSSWAQEIEKHAQKKQDWNNQTKVLEEYFNQKLEQITADFDGQLRELVEKHEIELKIMD